jgi:hypothetical protein
VNHEITREPQFFMNSRKIPPIPEAFPFFRSFTGTSISLREKSGGSYDLDPAFLNYFKLHSSVVIVLLNYFFIDTLEVFTMRFAIIIKVYIRGFDCFNENKDPIFLVATKLF